MCISVLLCEFGGNVPMIKNDTAINSLFELSQFLIALNCIVSHAGELEAVSKFIKKRIVFWDFLDDLSQTIIVLEHSKCFN